MELRTNREEQTLTVALRGDLDHHAARPLMDRLNVLIDRELPAKLVLDLGELSFMDSSGIAVILRAKRSMEALGGNLVVIHIPRQAAKVLEAAGLGRYVKLI